MTYAACPHCDGKMRIDEADDGEQLRCATCQRALVLSIEAGVRCLRSVDESAMETMRLTDADRQALDRALVRERRVQRPPPRGPRRGGQ